MTINREQVRERLQSFDFRTLFIEDMGWSNPANTRPTPLTGELAGWTRTPIAGASGVTVFEVSPGKETSGIPDAKTRRAIHKQTETSSHEHLLIFVDAADPAKRAQSLWSWIKREGGKQTPREHLYLKGQPGDLFLSKLDNLVIELDELRADGTMPITEVTARLSASLDMERVTRQFYTDFSSLRVQFIDLIQGIEREADRFWYASVLLNRLMFVYFLQKKGFIQDNTRYLDEKLAESKTRGADQFYITFLKALFFEGFAKPETARSSEAKALLGPIKYLNGGLFLPHQLEETYTGIRIPDSAFESVLALFGRYSWHLDDTPGAADNEINPDVLGYIFEKYINQKAFGAYYTRSEITQYLCERTIDAVIVDKVNAASTRQFNDMGDILLRLDAPLCRTLLAELPKLSILDPACGSGAFLVAAMKTLLNLYSAIFGKIEFLNDSYLTGQLKQIRAEHPSINYYIRKRIITDNLYGVDIMAEATEIAKLRLFLFLVSSAHTVEQLEPLPNIDFNIMCGNSLIGLLTVDGQRFDTKGQADMFQGAKAARYSEIVAEKNRLIASYRFHAGQVEDLGALRDKIDAAKQTAYAALNEILLDDFRGLKIQYEQALANGKTQKRPLTQADIDALDPFHWGYEFDDILGRGGFDIIIANPPWETFKPQSKEFFADYSDIVTTKKMRIEDFDKEQARLLQDPDINAVWLAYQSRFPHVSAYYRSAPQYINQISIVNGKKAGTDINLYKLFTEQCYNLLRKDGLCGIVIPSGIYTDLGAKQLREMLFSKTQVGGLFCFENRKEIFEGVHRSFKFVVLTFSKGGKTERFPATFMRHDVAELDHFPQATGLSIELNLIRRLSPDTLSITEFSSATDVSIAEKTLSFPALGTSIDEKWNLVLGTEFHMTNDSYLFNTNKQENMLPLYEGKMIHQFTHVWDGTSPRYWLQETQARTNLIGRAKDDGQFLGYQTYRLAMRRIARNTDTRTLISTILPKRVFASESFHVSTPNGITPTQLLFVSSVLNSFVVDSLIRLKVSANVSMHFVYDLPIPRLVNSDPFFTPIVERAARLICTTPEFDDLAKSVGLPGHQLIEPAVRAQLRAEIDAMVAHIYGLTEDEFTHILGTFPLVAQEVKDAALAEYRKIEPPKDKDEPTEAMIQRGSVEELIAKIQDAHIQTEAKRGYNNLANDPDMAVFKIAKLFEDMLIKYYHALVARGSLKDGEKVISSKSTPPPFEIINLLVKNGYLQERKALDVLRVERNIGGHVVRTAADQEELGFSGEIYIRWYLYYLTMFEGRLAGLGDEETIKN